MVYSRELIQQTIDMWQPHSEDKLTEEDAREIIDNVTNLFEYLAELDKKYNFENAKKKVEEQTDKSNSGI